MVNKNKKRENKKQDKNKKSVKKQGTPDNKQDEEMTEEEFDQIKEILQTTSQAEGSSNTEEDLSRF